MACSKPPSYPSAKKLSGSIPQVSSSGFAVMHSHVSRTRLERLALRCSICTLREALIEAKRCKTMQNPSKFAKQLSEIPYELDGYLGFFHSEAQVLFKRLPCLLHYLHHPNVMAFRTSAQISSCIIVSYPSNTETLDWQTGIQ